MFRLTPTHDISSTGSTYHANTLRYLLDPNGRKSFPKKPGHILKEPTIYRPCIEDLNG